MRSVVVAFVLAASTCGAGQTCSTVAVVPACALGDGACDACAEDVALCVPGGDGD
jgi:hypothetical protein